MAKRSQAEYHLQCAVADLLRERARPGVFWTAIPMGEFRGPIAGARVKAMGGRAGCPDMLVMRKVQIGPDMLVLARPVILGLELKAPGGTPSAVQELVMDQWIEAGGSYFVARSFREAHDRLKGYEFISPLPAAKIKLIEAHLAAKGAA